MSTKYKLVYFNVRGRGELLRLLLHTAGIQFVDQRVEFSEWPALKPNSPEEMLPYMYIDDKAFGESLPLARHIARKYNLMGATDLDQLSADIILNYIDDIRSAYSRSMVDKSLTDAQKKELKESASTVLLPKLLPKMEQRLAENKNGFLIGNTITIADLAFYDIVETFLKEAPKLLEKFPKIREHRKKIFSYPRISQYLAKRPDTKF